MNILSQVYSRILISEYLSIPHGTKEMEEMISKDLEEIYYGYQTDTTLNNYINKQLNMYLSFLTSHQKLGALNRNISGRTVPSEIRLRSSGKNRQKFVKLYKSLYNTLSSLSSGVNFCDSDLEDLILGYLHLCKINFQDDILNNLDYILQGSVSRFYLYNSESKEEMFNQEIYSAGSLMYKIKDVGKGRKMEKYAIPFIKTSPLIIIKIAMYDPEVMLKTHHLFTDVSIFLKLSKEQQNAVKNFVEERKQEHLKIFGKSKDGVYPLISKDVVGLVNHFIYPELDVSKRVRQILERCETQLLDFENKIENEGTGDVKKDSFHFTKSIILLISYFLNACDEILALKSNPSEWRQELMQVSSYIWKLLKLNVVRYFTISHQKFNDTVEAKRKEMKMDVERWKEEWDDVDWFLEILKA